MTSSDHILTTVNRIDALFKEADLNNYFLSVQVGERTFSYCILDSLSNKYIALGDYHLPLAKTSPLEQPLSFDQFISRVMAVLPLLKKPFRACKVIWEGTKTTLLPESLFDENDQQKLLSFNVNLDPWDMVRHDRLKHFQAVNVFAVPERVEQILIKNLAVDQIHHLTSALIESLYCDFRNQLSRPKVFLHIRDPWFDLLIMDQAKLHFVNMFEFHHPEDLVYYTLFVLEQVGLNPEQAEVVLLGKINKNMPCYNLLFKYIRRIEFARRHSGYQYSSVFNEIPPQAYFPLLNLNLCGL